MKIMMNWNSIREILKGEQNDTQHRNNSQPITSPIYYDGVQLTYVQCHMVPISILWYREYWTVQLKRTFETKQELVAASYHPAHQHGPTNIWYVYLFERAFNYLDYSYNVLYICMYIINGGYGPQPRSSVCTYMGFEYKAFPLSCVLWCLVTSGFSWYSPGLLTDAGTILQLTHP